MRDLAQVLDEKVEQETERDVYKSKYDRLNAELNRLLRTDDHHIIDIDALVMDNRSEVITTVTGGIAGASGPTRGPIRALVGSFVVTGLRITSKRDGEPAHWFA